MKRTLAIAIVAGAAWGAAVPLLSGRAAVTDLLWAEGLFLAAAWGIGRLAGDLRAGAACAAAFVVAFEAGRELVPWRGFEAQLSNEDLEPSVVREFSEAYDQTIGVNWRLDLAALVIGAVAGTRHPATWALLAGALVADLARPLPAVVPRGWSLVHVATALAGVYVAARFVRPRRALALALLPIAVILLGPDVLNGTHPEISIIR